MVTLLVREMARRKRGSGTKVSTRKSPRNTRKTNGLPQEAVNGLLEPSGSEKESEETSVVQDDDNVKPLEVPLTCRTPVEMCQKDSNLEELVPAHVHKKFGAVRCVVSEEEPVSSVEVQQEGETTEVMWEEAVVEETILCEGMEVEYTGPDDQQMVIVSRDDEVLQVIGIPKELESQVILVKEVDYDMGQEDEDRGIEEIHAVKTLTLVDSEDSSGPLRGFEDASQDSEVSVRGVELEIQGEEEVGGPQIDSDSQQGLMSLLQVASAEHQAAMLDDESSLLVVTAARDAEDSSRDSSKKERETSSDDVDTRDTEANYPETMERREMALVLGIEYNSQEGTNAMESNGAHTSGMLMEEEDTSSAIKEITNTSDLFVPPIVEENSNHKTTEEENSNQEEILNDPPPLFRGSDEDSEKKQHNQPSFRSRSGSTDTTGSESSSSCSAGIRRSNRIRSIGVTRQRIRTRWEAVPEQKLSDSLKKVEYPVTIDSPHTYSDKEICCEVKSDFRDSSDGSSGPDVHSDRDSSEVNVIKVPVPLSFPALSQTLSSITVPSFDIDISKPVKVKSRWRRSSELEMVGNKNIDGELVMTSPTPSMSPSPRLTLSPKTSIHQRPPLGVIAPSISPQSVVSPSSPLLDITSFSVSAEQVLKEPTQDNLEMEDKLRQFVPLPENEYLTNRSTSKEAKRMVCDCFLTQEEIIRGEMGCGEDCLNRLLMLECGARCPVSERCTNKRFQKQDYAKCEVFKTEKKGFGLRALEDLTTGSFLLEYVGEVLDPKEFRRRAKEYSKDKNRHYYFMALKSDSIIDATMKGNISRFINHSCDPNAETQKWTVNGELRIGFFCKRSIVSGEEVTFDYQLQRYGKEAQRCHCETALCRGWIGEDPDKEREKHERKERKDRESKRKKEERRKDVKEFLDDMDLEEEIEKLCVSGLKNRNHTLTLSRLMVRAEDSQSREQLLKLLQGGEPACRRLFLDYHGLRLIWSWMMNLGCTNQTNSLSLRLEILQTLSKLPIPNKTMLQESKVFGVVEKWSVDIGSDSSANSTPCHEMDRKERSSVEDESGSDVDASKPRTDPLLPVKVETADENMLQGIESEKQLVDSISVDSKQPPDLVKMEWDDEVGPVVKSKESEEASTGEGKEPPGEDKQQNELLTLAARLLEEWATLKEVFRIPKKERIEQMKEHEREADRGYKEYLDREEHHDKQSYDRHWRRPEHDRPRNKRSRESPDPDRNRKGSRYEDRTIIPIPRISKEERRHLFAMKVEEEERQRREQDELWRHHEERCMALGVDPQLTAAFDPQTGYPCFFDHTQGIWQAYPPPQDPSTIPPGAVPPEIRPSPLYTPSPHIPPNNPHGVIPSTHLLPGDYGTNNPHIPPLPYDPPPQPHLQPGYMDPLLPEFIPLPSGPQPQTQSLYAPLPQTLVPPQPPLPPVKLPPKWKAAKDSEGRTYYYHVKTRLSQWEFPVWPDDLTAQQETDSSSGSSDEDDDEEDDDEEESSSEEDDELDKGEDDDDEDDDEEIADEVKEDKRESSIVNSLSIPASISPLSIPLPAMELSPVPQEDISLEDEELQKKERRREGLVQERIISPRRDEDRTDMKKYREIKEKLRRKKEQVRAKEKKKQRHRDTKQHSEKPVTVAADTSSNTERKIKDHFRLQMAGVIVQYLNPYRKPDCKKGRITNTEDFKYLARRLTHFVMIKELRHCCSVVDDLECNDNVKHKARDFIKKYMAKFGATYQRPPEKKTHI